MKFGLIPAISGGVNPTPEYLRAVVVGAERNGFDSVWMGEHIALPVQLEGTYPGQEQGLPAPGESPMPDPLDWLSFAAATSELLLLGTCVLLVPLHHPLTLAKRLATIDQLSGGRLLAGVGIGWSRQEYAALSVPFELRGKRLEEYIAAMRRAWRHTHADFAGDMVRFDPVWAAPKPRSGEVPILVGGNSIAAAERAGRIGDGYLPFQPDLQRLTELVVIARRAAEDAGRDPAGLEITTLGRPRRDHAAQLKELGVHRFLVFAGSSDDVDRLGERCRAAVD